MFYIAARFCLLSLGCVRFAWTKKNPPPIHKVPPKCTALKLRRILPYSLAAPNRVTFKVNFPLGGTPVQARAVHHFPISDWRTPSSAMDPQRWREWINQPQRGIWAAYDNSDGRRWSTTRTIAFTFQLLLTRTIDPPAGAGDLSGLEWGFHPRYLL